MSGLKQALEFVQQVRASPELQQQLTAAGVSNTLSELVAFAAANGYCFSESELRAAFKHDWAMRWHRYSAVT